MRTPYLATRGATFQLRLPIPTDLHRRFGRKELRWSLHTRTPVIAREKTMQAALHFSQLCAHIRSMPNLQPTDISAIAQRFYASLVANHELPGPIASEDLRRFDYHQAGYSTELIRLLEDQIACRDYATETRYAADRALAMVNQRLEDLSTNEQQQVLEGVARTLAEHVRFTRFRQRTALDPYTPADPLLRDPLQVIASAPASARAPTQSPRRGGFGGQAGELIGLYLETGTSRGTTARGPWRPKTRDEKAKSLKWFAELVGATTDVREITSEHIRQFRDAIYSLKKGAAGTKSLKENETSIAKLRIDANTANKLFGFAKEFLNWLAQDGYLDDAPGRTITVAVPSKAKSEQRRPFSVKELELFFSSPLFTGCKSHKKRMVPGDKIIRDDEFWLPLVLLYTGMRLSEPLQVAAEDVVVEGPTPHFQLLASKIELKNHGSERNVPIHPDLIAFGFADFVRNRQASNPKERLFRNMVSDGSLTNYVSTKLGRYVRAVGITDPRVVTHSLRHHVKDVLRNAKVPKDVADRITGHAPGTTGDNYGAGGSLETHWSYLAQADFGLSQETKLRLQKPVG